MELLQLDKICYFVNRHAIVEMHIDIQQSIMTAWRIDNPERKKKYTINIINPLLIELYDNQLLIGTITRDTDRTLIMTEFSGNEIMCQTYIL